LKIGFLIILYNAGCYQYLPNIILILDHGRLNLFLNRDDFLESVSNSDQIHPINSLPS